MPANALACRGPHAARAYPHTHDQAMCARERARVRRSHRRDGATADATARPEWLQYDPDELLCTSTSTGSAALR